MTGVLINKTVMTEQTMTVELTETQYKHIQEVLAMDKPSKTRLTSTEKSVICNLLRSMISELGSVPHPNNEFRETTGWEESQYLDAQETIKEYKSIVKKLTTHK